jgi:hypothetical protein
MKVILILLITYTLAVYMDPMLFEISAGSAGLGGIAEFAFNASAVYQNPAILAIQPLNIAITTYKLIDDIDYINIATNTGPIGIGFISIGTEDKETALNNYGEAYSTRTFQYKNNLYLFNYHLIRHSMLYGINLKLYQGTLHDINCLGINIDLGMTYKFTENIWFSNSVRNIIAMGRFGIDWDNNTSEQLQTVFSTAVMVKNNPVSFYFKYEMIDFMIQEGLWHIGTELDLFGLLKLQAGLQEKYTKPQKKETELSYGIILRTSVLQIEVSQKLIKDFLITEHINLVTMSLFL